jgi:hypothetical protein
MPRIIEIVFFLIPFLSFVAWRLFFPSPLPPPWLMYGLSGFLVLMLIALLFVWHLEAEDANQHYLPDELHDGRIVPARPAASP